MKNKNEKLFKRLDKLIDEFCEDDDLNIELFNDLEDLDYEAWLCNVNLSNLIKTSPTYYNEIKRLENKKLFSEIEYSISKVLAKEESKSLLKEVSNVYIESCDSNKRLIDLIKSNEDLHFRLNNLKKIGFKNEQSNI
jgi:hypothetical protein